MHIVYFVGPLGPLTPPKTFARNFDKYCLMLLQCSKTTPVDHHELSFACTYFGYTLNINFLPHDETMASREVIVIWSQLNNSKTIRERDSSYMSVGANRNPWRH